VNDRARELARHVVDSLAARSDAPPRSRADFWLAVQLAVQDAYATGAAESR
jgi:hypothetical protein